MKKLNMRIATLVFSMFILKLSFGQELNIGMEFAGGPRASEAKIVALGPIIEYRPVKSLVSLNSGVLFFVYKDQSLVTFPLSLKVIIGKTVRFCPSIGGFIRTNKNFGYSAGILIDYKIKRKISIYLKGEFNQDYWKDDAYDHFGGSSEIHKTYGSYWIGIGLKINVI